MHLWARWVPLLLHNYHNDTKVCQGCINGSTLDLTVWTGFCVGIKWEIEQFAWGPKLSLLLLFAYNSPPQVPILGSKTKMKTIILQHHNMSALCTCQYMCACLFICVICLFLCVLFLYFSLCQWKPCLWSTQFNSVQKEWQKEAPASSWHLNLKKRYSTHSGLYVLKSSTFSKWLHCLKQCH